MISSNASLSYSEIIDAAAPSQTLFFQFYKHKNDSIAELRVREVERLGYKAVFLTVDAIVAGNRERDIRNPWELEDEERGTPTYWLGEETPTPEAEVDGMGTAGALVANDDRDMTWEKVFTSLLFLHCILILP
jgi:L-lactate dehydrogenase (cytochrome)